MPDYKLAARRAAAKYNIDPRIFQAMIQQESGFRPVATSGAGAQGIAQFMPATAKAYGVNLHDGRATDDLEGAAHYIADNLKRTGGNYHKALSIYNSGRPDAFRDPNFAKGQTYNYVKNILANAKNFGGGGSPSAAPSGGQRPSGGSRTTTTETTTFDQAGYDKARKGAILADYLQKVNPGSQLLRAGVVKPGMPDRTDFEQTTTSTKTTPLTQHVTGRGYSDTTAGLIQTLTDRANKIDAKKLPYQWGGGHGAKPVTPGSSVPVDCSGAVSSVLGLNPRVSGEFAKWGKPGKGRITVYANDKHVLMEINGHFFGTSARNPGGGAGWIPRSQISSEYLKGFTARHIDA
jgi:hypothetical protein